MPFSEIPEEQKQALDGFASLPQKEVDALLSLLRKAKPVVSPVALATQVHSKELGIELQNLQEIMRMLATLLIVVEVGGVARETVAADVVSAAVREKLPGIGPGTIGPDGLKARLLAFFSVDSLSVTAKAANVMSQHKGPFVGARILTDLRPIFSGEPPTAVAGVIVHNLEITTYTDGEPLSHFFALDTGDLRKLRSVLERAMRKEDSLKGIAEKSLCYIEASGPQETE